MTTTRATEARDLLFGCLRFAARYPDGTIKPGAPPVPYDEAVDDRTPVGFAMPPDLPFSTGPNRLWSTIVWLPRLDVEMNQCQTELAEAEALIRRLLESPATTHARSAIVDATRWLDRDAGDCDGC